MSLNIIILAAGQGKRMHSLAPKVLHKLAGRPLLEHVYHTAKTLNADNIYVVYGHGGEDMMEQLPHLDVDWIEQKEQLGTGHAVQQALSEIKDHDSVLVLYGDVPLITTDTLLDLINSAGAAGVSLLVCNVDDPRQYGRIIRNEQGTLLRIVEEKDASDEERQICEINTGMMLSPALGLRKWLEKLDNNNVQGEFYLTDTIAAAVEDGVSINTIEPRAEVEIRGINDRIQLSELERYYQLIQAHQLMGKGITIMDPSRFDLRGYLEIGIDCTIEINVILEGRLKIGSEVNIGANCQIKNSVIGDGVDILANSIIEDSVIGNSCRIGPFARIRPETTLDDRVQVGNFVEIKQSDIGNGTKINHLSYIGNSEIGKASNIGAGTITCNYDGAKKHKTVIGDNVFIGSDVQLIAPVTVDSGATVAAGTTITKDVAEHSLAISRTEQQSFPDWKRPEK